MKKPSLTTHQNGELVRYPQSDEIIPNKDILVADTYGGKVYVEWSPQAAVTPLGQLPFFIEFLKLGGVFDSWVEECPLDNTSPNSPSKTDVLGTLMLSVLSGHKRYAHVTAMRSDDVNPSLLGMRKIVSEDSLRSNLMKIPQEEGAIWLQNHLYKCFAPILSVPWIMDIDTTIKVLYGQQEAAVVGYNPKKPGRPSHTYHTYFIGNLRLVMDVEVQPGNQMSASFTAPNLWTVLESIPQNQWPEFLRGDCCFGTDGVMRAAEERGVPYLFKLKQSKNVSKEIKRLLLERGWVDAGHGWQGKESFIKLYGWEKSRRIVVLRKALKKESEKSTLRENEPKQKRLNISELMEEVPDYEYAVLITTLPDEILTIAQHYRDRADSENVFDELKNQWGWGGYTTQDLNRCSLVARVVGLVYNWWNLYARLAEPRKHLEAITSRPLLLHAIGRQTSHSGQTHLKITSTHGKIGQIKRILNRITAFFEFLKNSAEQFTTEQRWYRILSKALEKYLKGKILSPPS